MNDLDKKAVESFKQDAYRMLNRAIADNGGLPPCVAILTKIDDDYKAILTVVPDTFFNDENGKDKFVNDQLPKLFENLINENKFPICFMFASEAYVSVIDTQNSDIDLENLTKELKNENFVTEDKIKNLFNKDDLKMIKTECIIFSFETLNESELKVKKINRNGQVVNSKGELVDAIEFEDFELGDQEDVIKNASGRFSNILKRFYKNFANIS